MREIIMRYVLLLIMFTGCGHLKFVGNPEPNMKTIHMVSHHFGYTVDEYNKHPNNSCDGI